MKFLTFLLLFIFSVFINAALKCEFGGCCYFQEFREITNDFQRKTCENACAYFRCQAGSNRIMEGVGCHEDFVNACKYTSAEIKEITKNNTYVDSSVIYIPCTDGEHCATNIYKNFRENHRDIDRTFKYRPFIQNENEPISCEFDTSPLPILSSLYCIVRQTCSGGKDFEFEPLADSYQRERQCDACLYYHCTSDGKTIKTGWGCYDDFYAACKYVVNSDVEVKLKKDIKEAFYYDKNLAVLSCSNRDYCQYFDIPEIVDINTHISTEFLKNIDTSADGNCDNSITPIIPSTTTHPTTTVITTMIHPSTAAVVSSVSASSSFSPPTTTPTATDALLTSASSSSSTSAPTSTEFSPTSALPSSTSTPPITEASSSSSTSAAPSTTAFPTEPVQTTFTGACECGEVCYDYRFPTPNLTTTTKKCNEFCVYYKCLIIGELDGLFNVKEGYGCLNDFINSCTFTGYQTKDIIRIKGPNYKSHDEKLIYVSCNNKDGCAKEAYKNMIAVNASIKEDFGYQGISFNGSRECPGSLERDMNLTLYCDAKSWCKSGNEFSKTKENLWTKPKHLPSELGGVDACVSYMCTVDGKTITGGSGTFNNFISDCYSTLTFGQKALLDGKEKNIFYADKNVIFMSSDQGYGILDVKPFETYLKLNPELVKPFFDNINTTFDETCTEKNESITVKPQPEDENAVLDCDSGEVCYDHAYYGDFFNTTTKQCNGRCVYFKCIELGYSIFKSSVIDHDAIIYNVKEGYGCFEDFVNNCKFTGYQTKDMMKNGGSNYQYHDAALIYLSCNNTNGCAREAVEQMKTNNSAIEKEFGWKDKLSGSGGCFLGDSEQARWIRNGFKTTAWCKSGRQFESEEEVKERSSKTKYCDPSISFMCTSNGRLIKGGIGCIEDIKIACENIVSNDLIKKLEGNPGKLFYADENVIVSASTGLYSEHYFDIFLKINPALIKPFYDNIDGNSDELCDYQKPPKQDKNSDYSDGSDSFDSNHKPQALVAESHGTVASIKLFEIYLFALVLIYFL